MRLEELQMEHEYRLRLKDVNYNEKIKELSDKFQKEIKSLKTTQQVSLSIVMQCYCILEKVLCTSKFCSVVIQRHLG